MFRNIDADALRAFAELFEAGVDEVKYLLLVVTLSIDGAPRLLGLIVTVLVVSGMFLAYPHDGDGDGEGGNDIESAAA